MEQLTRFLCFTLCAFVVTCKSKHVEKTWQAVNDDHVVTITVSNRQQINSYANFQTFESAFDYNRDYIDKQLCRLMENLFNRGDLFTRISSPNFFPYYFIFPKFFNRINGFYVPNNLNPNMFQTSTVPTSIKISNKVNQLSTKRPQISGTRQLSTQRPQISGTRQFHVPIIPTLKSRNIVNQDSTTPPPIPEIKISTTTNINTESPTTTTAELQEVSTTQAQENEKGQFFDDEDDTTRPITFRDTKSSKSDRGLDKKFRKMPEVEHGSVQAGI
ncbi:PREDICTED: uncharacterized protein LOC106121327 isoform X2 [Papilio xuthus]|uniref:Uncharacterized protein LOC106121327 isoform X2 n=2 Tax=Papilio xuthus TaxID=66420 RepID=A0AAJ6ZGZ4_PAPXU|nr:PREDICTED: uncharacterized protein LOC106121327 isoform X2 [Papilio xuthus]